MVGKREATGSKFDPQAEEFGSRPHETSAGEFRGDLSSIKDQLANIVLQVERLYARNSEGRIVGVVGWSKQVLDDLIASLMRMRVAANQSDLDALRAVLELGTFSGVEIPDGLPKKISQEVHDDEGFNRMMRAMSIVSLFSAIRDHYPELSPTATRLINALRRIGATSSEESLKPFLLDLYTATDFASFQERLIVSQRNSLGFGEGSFNDLKQILHKMIQDASQQQGNQE